jgi:hypothetical protein
MSVKVYVSQKSLSPGRYRPSEIGLPVFPTALTSKDHPLASRSSVHNMLETIANLLRSSSRCTCLLLDEHFLFE